MKRMQMCRRLMWRDAGLVRSAEGLGRAVSRLEAIARAREAALASDHGTPRHVAPGEPRPRWAPSSRARRSGARKAVAGTGVPTFRSQTIYTGRFMEVQIGSAKCKEVLSAEC